jgi:hypothetical protein
MTTYDTFPLVAPMVSTFVDHDAACAAHAAVPAADCRYQVFGWPNPLAGVTFT